MKKILLFLVISFLIFFISSCEYFTLMSQKEWAEKSDRDEENVIIYASGARFDYSAMQYLPCYWEITKTGYKLIDLESNNTWGIAFSIYVEGDTVYTCGFDSPGTGGLVRACYWVNKKKYNLKVKDASTYSSQAYQIIYKNGLVFTTGYEENSGNTDAINWLEQDMSILCDSPPNSQAECIFIQQESSSKHYIYIGGMYSGRPCYWKDYQITYLEDKNATNMKVKSIYVIGNTVYSCGNKTAPVPEQACFWKNEKLTYLPGGTDARSLFISNEDIYIAGVNNIGTSYSCYWKNGEKYSLPASFFSGGNSYANSIFVFNNNVYIGGNDDDGAGTDNRAWYYVNGEKIILDSFFNAGILSIFVKVDKNKK